MSLILTSLDKGIATLTFNHPETCNSLSNGLLNELSISDPGSGLARYIWRFCQ